MANVETSQKGIGYIPTVLRITKKVVTRAVFWRIAHHTKEESDVCLKIGRYNRSVFSPETLENETCKSELTLDDGEFKNLIKFISDNYAPFKIGVKKYIPITNDLDEESIDNLKAIFANPDKHKLLEFIAKNNILPAELITNLQLQSKRTAVQEYETMLEDDLVEPDWQKWFKQNDWILGSEFVKIIDDRRVDTKNITDFLMQAYDGFLDIIEIKRPNGNLKFWADVKDHDNYIPSADLTKAITQATKYIYEVEREANSVKFGEQHGYVKVIKPRCILIFGRSNNWNDEQKEAYRILNASYHNLNIMTYDHVLSRAKRLLKDEYDLPF
jgi:hypothetical protein